MHFLTLCGFIFGRLLDLVIGCLALKSFAENFVNVRNDQKRGRIHLADGMDQKRQFLREKNAHQKHSIAAGKHSFGVDSGNAALKFRKNLLGNFVGALGKDEDFLCGMTENSNMIGNFDGDI